DREVTAHLGAVERGLGPDQVGDGTRGAQQTLQAPGGRLREVAGGLEVLEEIRGESCGHPDIVPRRPGPGGRAQAPGGPDRVRRAPSVRCGAGASRARAPTTVSPCWATRTGYSSREASSGRSSASRPMRTTRSASASRSAGGSPRVPRSLIAEAGASTRRTAPLSLNGG